MFDEEGMDYHDRENHLDIFMNMSKKLLEDFSFKNWNLELYVYTRIGKTNRAGLLPQLCMGKR